MNEHYQNAKKCLDQLLANDQISYYGYVELMVQLDAMKRENQVPSGKWIYHKGLSEHRECSNCKVWLDWSLVRNSYCPNCGAKMEEATKNESVKLS
ncbi:MAG: hypothetical protein K6A80_01665 [Saccharofermentans sp.]|nr:hypothetical protein [Saccharofermentans sp.]